MAVRHDHDVHHAHREVVQDRNPFLIVLGTVLVVALLAMVVWLLATAGTLPDEGGNVTNIEQTENDTTTDGGTTGDPDSEPAPDSSP